GSIEYNAELFDPDTIARLVGHLGMLLRGAASNADERVSQLPMITDAERRHLVVEWNDTHREHAMDRCFHELFEEQVKRTPDATAVVFEDMRLTYAELNRRTNQVAH